MGNLIIKEQFNPGVPVAFIRCIFWIRFLKWMRMKNQASIIGLMNMPITNDIEMNQN